jgi:hypothetical protein
VSQSRQALLLLPSLGDSVLLPQSRCQLAVDRIAELWHNRLCAHLGPSVLAELDALTAMLDSLIDERQLLESQSDESMLGDELFLLPSLTAVLRSTVRKKRSDRILELGTLISTVQEQLQRLTINLSPSIQEPLFSESSVEPSSSLEELSLLSFGDNLMEH